MLRIQRSDRRVLVSAVAGAAVLVTALGAQAGEITTRTKTYSYQGGCGLQLSIAGNGATGTGPQCVVGADYQLKRKSTEKYLTITVTDATGQPVAGEIWLSGGVGSATDVPFCGTLKNYKMTQTGYRMDLNEGVNTDCPGAATQGTIKVTYSSGKI